MGIHIPQSSISLSRPSWRIRLVQLLVAAATTNSFVSASPPYPKPDLLHNARYAYLLGRSCATFCGSDGQFCCGGDEHCTTLSGDVATCIRNGAIASPLYTTTWTETRTYTSTVLTWFLPPPAPTTGVDCVVPKDSDWSACGEICCANWQTCAFQGSCSAKPGYGVPSTVIVTSNGVVTTQYSAPYRVTGTTTVVTTGVRSTDAGTTTPASNTASSTKSHSPSATSDPDTAGAGGSGTANNKLSGGAIAGIVIGSLAAAGLLIFLCFCFIARGLFHAIFGKKREKVDRNDEYSNSNHSRRDRHSGWFGGGGGRPSSVSDRRSEKKSSGAKWLGLAGAAATLLALLNMKKDKKAPSRKGTSRYTDSYYSYSDYSGTAPSSASSGGRTARTGRTGRSARTRDSRDSRSRVTRSHYTARSSSRRD